MSPEMVCRRPGPRRPQRGGMIAHGLRPPTANGSRPGARWPRPVAPHVEDGAVPSSRIPGRSYVTRRALVEIVRAAALGSYGVTGLTDPRPSRRVLARLGLGSPAVQVSVRPALGIELYVTIAYGLPVAEVVRQVDSAVRHAVRRTVGCEVASIVIHVNGLRDALVPAPPTQPDVPAINAEPAMAVSEPAGPEDAPGPPPARPRRRRRPAAGSQPPAPH